MKNSLVYFLLFIFCLGFNSIRAEKITIVTRDYQQPFAFLKDGRRVGYAYELWEQVAKEAGLEFEVTTEKTANDMINAVKNNKADVAIGALSVTAQREEQIDFSQPFYDSGFQILINASSDSGFLSGIWQLFSKIFNIQALALILLLFGLMAIVSHLVWRYEHKVNESMWPKNYKKGIWESFWWTISILLAGGADNKGPVGVGGRIVAMIWMFLSIVLVSMLTATFTTTLTVKSLKGDIEGPGDLPGHNVATVKGSTAENWLETKGITTYRFDNVNDCIRSMKSGKVAAVVYDAPMLQYAANQSGDEKLSLVGPVFDRQNYAFAMKNGSELRERINHALLLLNEKGVCSELRKKWFGSEE